MVFIIVGMLGIIMKGSRFVYILLSMEMMILGMIMFNLTIMSELNFMITLIFSVSSSAVGLIMMVNLMSHYGSDYVKM